MKVLLISLSNNYDHQLSLYSLYEEMAKSGIDVFTLGIKEPKYSISFSDRNIFIDAPQKPGISAKAFKTKPLKKVYKRIVAEQFDVVYFESLHLWNVYLFKKLKKRLGIVHSIHDVIPHEGKLSFFIKLFNKTIYKNSNYVLVRSKSAFDYCNSQKKIPHEKIVFLPLGRKWRDYYPLQNTKNVLFFGRVTKYKGLDNLMTICENCQNINFLVVGKPIEKDDVSQLNLLKQYSNVTVHDRYVSEEEMIDFFHQSDCVILPYRSATQSGVIVDSYSLSRPCIAFDVGGIQEQIVDGKTGFLVKGDNDAFKDRIVEFLSFSDSKKEEICKNAYNFGKNNYSAKHLSDELIKLFDRMIKDKK